MYLIFNKMFYSVSTQLPYINSLATRFGFLQNHLQAVVSLKIAYFIVGINIINYLLDGYECVWVLTVITQS